jgi:hypothetical protein
MTLSAPKIAAREHVLLIVQGFLRSQANDYAEVGREMLVSADGAPELERNSLLASAARQYEKAEACLAISRQLETPAT